MSAKSPTMKDVANLSGVSIQTVSCVINGKGDISDETRERVLRVIEEINYQRNPLARGMRTGRTGLISLMVQDITNPVLSMIASRIQSAVGMQEYHVLLHDFGLDAQLEQAALESISPHLNDGIIIVNTVDQENVLALIEQKRLPAVVIDAVDRPGIASVSVDNFRSAYLATEYLISLGHTRIAHISGPQIALQLADQRRGGYEQALADHGIDDVRIVSPPNNRWDYRAGYEATRLLLGRDSTCTAIFAAGDELAIGAYRAIGELGLRIPHDISVVGFDNIAAAEFATPPLTTIRQPFLDIADHAVALLFQLLNGKKSSSVPRISLEPELIIRQSTARRQPPKDQHL